ncbi:MAG TPA: DUF86 domain-containing protein [bacterium]|nr:DUF86 domain-containing protein [bacterium]
MVDRPLIERKLALLDEKKRELEGYAVASLDDFKSKGYMQKAVEKMLQEMVEIGIDVAKHIVADEGFRMPEDAGDTFKILEENKVLTPSTTQTMTKMVGFRNLIVHLYEKIDLEIVYGHYKKRLGDFDTFSREILQFLRR